jgi:hypothetical protein
MVISIVAIVIIAAVAVALDYHNASDTSSPKLSPSPTLTPTASPATAGTNGPTAAPTQTNSSAVITFTVEPKIRVETSNST